MIKCEVKREERIDARWNVILYFDCGVRISKGTLTALAMDVSAVKDVPDLPVSVRED